MHGENGDRSCSRPLSVEQRPFEGQANGTYGSPQLADRVSSPPAVYRRSGWMDIDPAEWLVWRKLSDRVGPGPSGQRRARAGAFSTGCKHMLTVDVRNLSRRAWICLSWWVEPNSASSVEQSQPSLHKRPDEFKHLPEGDAFLQIAVELAISQLPAHLGFIQSRKGDDRNAGGPGIASQ